VPERVQAHGGERLEVRIHHVARRGLQQHLVLIELLEAMRVLAVAPVLGAARRLDVGDAPRLGPERAQERGGIEGPGADLGRVGLLEYTAALGPERFGARGSCAASGMVRRGMSATTPVSDRRERAREAGGRRLASTSRVPGAPVARRLHRVHPARAAAEAPGARHPRACAPCSPRRAPGPLELRQHLQRAQALEALLGACGRSPR
jgi:hypothetical protein